MKILAIPKCIIRMMFDSHAVAPGILSPPVLANGFSRFVQPIRVSEQGDQLDGAKKFTAFVRGLPSARSLPALMRTPASSVVQFNGFATSPAKRRAGSSLAARAAKAVCFTSSVMVTGGLHQDDDLIRTEFQFRAQHPCGPPTRLRQSPDLGKPRSQGGSGSF